MSLWVNSGACLCRVHSKIIFIRSWSSHECFQMGEVATYPIKMIPNIVSCLNKRIFLPKVSEHSRVIFLSFRTAV